MPQKHYNIEYLKDTAQIMGDVKKYSYSPFLNVRKGIVLDLGCGTGTDLINMAALSKYEVNYIGVDHDEKMIAQANLNKNNLNVQFLQRDVYPLPFEDNSISGIRAERLLQHLPNVDDVLKEIYRVMAPNAPLVIVETDWNSISFYNTSDTKIEQKIRSYYTKTKVVNGEIAKKLISFYQKLNFKKLILELHLLY